MIASSNVYVLDTNVVRAIFHHPGQQALVERRIRATDPNHLFLSSISLREVLRGALEVLRNQEKKGRLVEGYGFLESVFHDLARFQILSFDEQAYQIYKAFPSGIKRIGKEDCRIAAIAIAHRFIVVTFDKDYSEIPNVQVKDWSKRDVD